MKGKKIYIKVIFFIIGVLTCCEIIGNKTDRTDKMQSWVESANLSDQASSEELYKAALEEDTLVIYSVSSRVFDVKTRFEEEYPELTVDIRDVRGDDIVEMVLNNYEKKDYACDLVICSDCDGSLYKKLIEPGVVYPYIPWDIASNVKDGHAERELVFLGEAMMFIYNNEIFESQPIENLWELTEAAYKGKIIMANPLSSFSTYGFCSALITESEAMEKAYMDYCGEVLTVPEGKCAGEIFWERVAPNIIFTNSSDEVMEGVGNSGSDGVWIGIMISSKMRYQDIGYHLSPIYELEPFSAVYTPNSVTIAGGSKNINSAKLFIRYLLGETDGKGEGLLPFSTVGTWSSRTDVEDGNPIPLREMDIVYLNKEFIYDNRTKMCTFWEELLKENVVE